MRAVLNVQPLNTRINVFFQPKIKQMRTSNITKLRHFLIFTKQHKFLSICSRHTAAYLYSTTENPGDIFLVGHQSSKERKRLYNKNYNRKKAQERIQYLEASQTDNALLSRLKAARAYRLNKEQYLITHSPDDWAKEFKESASKKTVEKKHKSEFNT